MQESKERGRKDGRERMVEGERRKNWGEEGRGAKIKGKLEGVYSIRVVNGQSLF